MEKTVFHAVSRPSEKDIVDEIGRVLPTERPKPQFDTLLNWGRYAEIFHYSRDEDRFQIAKVKTP